MNRCLRLGVILFAFSLTAGTAHADSVPPPQPPTCAWCDGPPPVPVPVPTVAPVAVAPVSVISVNLTPTHVQRGHVTDLEIDATAGDSVSAVVAYHGAKPALVKTAVGDSGSVEKMLKIPKDIAPGKAQLKVTVTDPSGPYTTTIDFVVVK
jgi:hypothetical protein